MKNRHYKSFTLTETLIWVAVIAISAGISLHWMLQSYWQWSFEQQATQLLKDIEMARSLALYKREAISLHFIESSNSYRVYIDQDSPDSKAYIERKLNRRTGFLSYYGIHSLYYYDEQGILRTGAINFGGSASYLRFTYQGVPDRGGHVALYSDALDKVLVVIVKPVTGRARIGRVRAFYFK